MITYVKLKWVALAALARWRSLSQKNKQFWPFLISLAFLDMSEDQEIKISETSSTRHIRIDITQFALGLVSGGIIQGNLEQRRLDPGKETPEGFFQVRSQKEYQNVVIISFVHLEKRNIFCFMPKSVA